MRRMVAALVGRETRVSGPMVWRPQAGVWYVQDVRSADAGGWEIQRRPDGTSGRWRIPHSGHQQLACWSPIRTVRCIVVDETSGSSTDETQTCRGGGHGCHIPVYYPIFVECVALRRTVRTTVIHCAERSDSDDRRGRASVRIRERYDQVTVHLCTER